MSRPDVDPLREILHRLLLRYLTVRPNGFILQEGATPRAQVDARILGHGGARTFYRNRKPECRSLDGIRPVTGDTKRTCADCNLKSRCTPQVRIDLFIDQVPFRLLLAYSSARAFFRYEAHLHGHSLAIEDVMTSIQVVNRGHWGELRFSKRD